MEQEETKPIRQRLRQSRAFIFSLMAIFVIWLVSSMSEQKTFREQYRIYFDGIDNEKYATLATDSILALDITSNGFYAFRRGIEKNKSIHIDVSNLIDRNQHDIQLELDINEYIDIIRRQIDSRGVSAVKPVGSTLGINLSIRECKAFVPNIDNVVFQFDDMSGLCGFPELKPDTVYLYGSRSVLDKIDALEALPQTIKNIRITGLYKIKLDTVWKKYPDLHTSAESIDIFLPVETFTEKSIAVPLHYSADKNVKRIQLYPSTVTVKCLVPKRLYNSIDAADFEANVCIGSDSINHLQPVVTRFPANVRVKSISPEKVQYIIIQ